MASYDNEATEDDGSYKYMGSEYGPFSGPPPDQWEQPPPDYAESHFTNANSQPVTGQHATDTAYWYPDPTVHDPAVPDDFDRGSSSKSGYQAPSLHSTSASKTAFPHTDDTSNYFFDFDYVEPMPAPTTPLPTSTEVPCPVLGKRKNHPTSSQAHRPKQVTGSAAARLPPRSVAPCGTDTLPPATMKVVSTVLEVCGSNSITMEKLRNLAALTETDPVAIQEFIDARRRTEDVLQPGIPIQHQPSIQPADQECAGKQVSLPELQPSGNQRTPHSTAQHEHPVPPPVKLSSELITHLEEWFRDATNAACKPSSTNNQKYKCTLCRTSSFKRKEDWTRHERLRLPDTVFYCRLCLESRPGAAPCTPFKTTRKDKMRDHMKSNKHSDLELTEEQIEQKIDAGYYHSTRLLETQCGWGDYVFRNLEDRFDHLADHYNGKYEDNDVRNYWRKVPGDVDTRICVLSHKGGRKSESVRVDNRDGGQDVRSPDAPPEAHKATASDSHQSHGGRSGTYSTTTRGVVPLDGLSNGPSFMIFDHDIGLLDALLEGPSKLHRMEVLGRGDHGRVIKVGVYGESRLQAFALKHMDSLGDRVNSLQHFRREVNTLAKLKHPSIVRIIAASTDQVKPELVMLPVAQTDLNQILKHPERHPQVRSHEILRGYVSLATGLMYLHDAQILHNDIKPSNILVDEASLLYTDFGASTGRIKHNKSCQCPSYSGSSAYAAPEVKAGNQPSEKSDVYSLGLVFLEMLLTWTSGSVQALRSQSDTSLESAAAVAPDTSGFYRAVTAVKSSLKNLRGRTAEIGDRLLFLTAAMLQGDSARRPNALEVTADLSRLLHVLPPTLTVNRASIRGLPLPAQCTHFRGSLKDPIRACPSLRSGVTTEPHNACWTITIQRPDVLVRYRKLRKEQSRSMASPAHCCSSASWTRLPPKLVEIYPSEDALLCRVIKPHEILRTLAPVHYLVFADRTEATAQKKRHHKPRRDLSEQMRFSALSYAMQEAINIASTLGISYLWTEEHCSVEGGGDKQKGMDQEQGIGCKEEGETDPDASCLDLKAIWHDAVAVVTMTAGGMQDKPRTVSPLEYLQLAPPLSRASSSAAATHNGQASYLSSVGGWLDTIPLLKSIELPLRNAQFSHQRYDHM